MGANQIDLPLEHLGMGVFLIRMDTPGQTGYPRLVKTE